MRVITCAAVADGIATDSEPSVIRTQQLTAGWRGAERWRSAGSLCEWYGGMEFELAADVRLSLREYVDYARENHADCPYYCVARSFEGERAALLEDYQVPSPFADDCLGLIPGSRMARYWFVGGCRSGTFLHADPLCTSAWNVCTSGAKRWVFLPPETDLAALGLETYSHGKQQVVADWFLTTLPTLRAHARAGRVRLLECLQQPGDCVYVPAGWYHTVLNLSLSVAISQNFHAAAALPALWPRLSSTHQVYARVLRDVLQAERPDVEAALPPTAVEDVPAAVAAASQGDGQSTSCELPLFWRQVDVASAPPENGVESTASVLFVEAGWLSGWRDARPSAATCRREGSAAPLFRAYEQLNALARALRQRRSPCLLMLAFASEAACHEQLASLSMLLRELGVLEGAATLPTTIGLSSTALAVCARAHGACEWAVLRTDEREAAVVRAMTELPTSSIVQARISDQEGVTLHCARSVRAGERLVSVPLSACVAVDADDDAAHQLAETLLDLDASGDLRAQYFRRFAPYERLARGLMVCWAANGRAGTRVAPTVAWRRATHRRAQMLAEARAGVAEEDALWSRCVVDTRSMTDDDETRRLLVPVVDLANHCSLGASARVEVRTDCVDLIAEHAMDEGDEVTRNYDPDADYADIFERYGFFDASAVVHTSEVVVAPELLPVKEQWAQAQLALLAERGCDAAFNAWWVPDHHPEDCPLFEAARLTACNKVEAAETLARLLRAHLARCPTSLAEDEEALRRTQSGEAAAWCDADEVAALRLLIFEKTLLGQALGNLIA